MEKMPFTISPSGFRKRASHGTSLFFPKCSAMATIMDTTCPITVAQAAPDMPSAGKPKSPNIITGSKTILVSAPQTWAIVEYMVFPVDCSSFSNIPKYIRPKLTNIFMRRYELHMEILT